MSDEIRVKAQLQAIKTSAGLNFKFRPIAFNADLNGDAVNVINPTLSTSWEALVFETDMSSNLGVCQATNLSSTDGETIQLGKWTGATGEEFVEILPGETFPFRLAPNKSSIAARALAGTPQLLLEVLED